MNTVNGKIMSDDVDITLTEECFKKMRKLAPGALILDKPFSLAHRSSTVYVLHDIVGYDMRESIVLKVSTFGTFENLRSVTHRQKYDFSNEYTYVISIDVERLNVVGRLSNEYFKSLDIADDIETLINTVMFVIASGKVCLYNEYSYLFPLPINKKSFVKKLTSKEANRLASRYHENLLEISDYQRELKEKDYHSLEVEVNYRKYFVLDLWRANSHANQQEMIEENNERYQAYNKAMDERCCNLVWLKPCVITPLDNESTLEMPSDTCGIDINNPSEARKFLHDYRNLGIVSMAYAYGTSTASIQRTMSELIDTYKVTSASI